MSKNFNFKKIILLLIVSTDIICNSMISNRAVNANTNQSEIQTVSFDDDENIWDIQGKYYFEENAMKDIYLNMEKIWEKCMVLTIRSSGIQINKSDDDFLSELKKIFIKDAYLDFYHITRNETFVAKLKGSYELKSNDQNISKIDGKLSNVLILYLNLSKLCINDKSDKEENIVQTIKDINEAFKQLPLYTRKIIGDELNKKIFNDKYKVNDSKKQFYKN